MPILRRNPVGGIWNELDRAQFEMSRFLQYLDTPRPEGPSGVPFAYPPVNVRDDDENIYLEAELPGLTPEDLEITMTDGNRLTLKGQRKPPEVGKATWHRQERGFGSFNRTLALPVLVDSDRVEAHFELGELRVKLPKSPGARPRRIEVKRG
jgi:HSP20 family protein